MDGWSEFAVAAAGATAALAGLVIVGISVNIKEILAFPGLTARAAAAPAIATAKSPQPAVTVPSICPSPTAAFARMPTR